MIFNQFKVSERSQQEKWSKNIFLLGLIIVLLLTLLPFDFEDPQGNYILAIVTSFGHHTDKFDLLGNLLLFIPFGFGLAGVLEKRRLGFVKTALVVIVSSLSLSSTVEILQVFLPERASTSIDILSNTTSGFWGFLIYYLGNDRIFNIFFGLSRIGKRWLNFKWAIAIFISYLIATCFLLFSFRDSTKLSNWDVNYPLLVGNELTADRPWKGQVSQFCIADRAASKSEVAQLLSDRTSCQSISQSLLASYQFNGNQKQYPDLTQNLPDLISQGTPPKKKGSEGIFSNYKHWLQTEESVKLLAEKLEATSQMTLVSTIATADTNQGGPARIISLSKNPFSRNFTFGQEGNDLSFRLRTPLTKENGNEPESIVPNVFADTEFHRVAIVYDGWTIKIYVDQPRNVYKLQLSPDAALFWSAMSVFDKTVHLNPPSMFVYKVLYYGILFIPLGILFAIVWVSYRGSLIFSLLAIACGILLPALLVEGVIASCMERSLQIGNIGMGIALEVIAFLFSQNGFANWRRSTVN
jgi:glycopeptide antibiotics resistance protein